jgi:MoaA/NifB/PqqE/SkfB family radical SAM enzyme
MGSSSLIDLPRFSQGLGIFKSLCAIKFFGKRIPLYCEWELTNYCNMTCTFCSTMTEDRNAAPDLTLDRACQMLDQLYEMGTRIVHFSGGEPTLWKDFPALISKAKKNHMMVSFTTNGSSSKEKMSQFLDADIIRVSIDGTEKFHDLRRQSDGAFNKAVDTLKYLRSKGKRPLITTVYMEDTPSEMIEELVVLAKSLGANISVNAIGRNLSDQSLSSELQGEEGGEGIHSSYVSLMNKLRHKYGRVCSNPEPFLSVVKAGGLDVYGCRAMDVAISIKPDGSVWMPCTGLGKSKMKGDNLREIYYGAEAEELRGLQGRAPLCKGCNIRCMSSASSLLNVRGQLSLFDAFVSSVS